ncbi:MAG: hypothetical protein RMI83_06730 [Desulfurococcaceae archaeon]|nr:hypothetical protein [Desulfurococcaceae archaeon]
MEIVVRVDIGRYKYIDLPLEKAIEFLERIAIVRGTTLDITESLRYIRNFDEFYEYMKRKFKDFISPPKDHREIIEGLVAVQKLKLYIVNDVKMVTLVIDKRVCEDFLHTILKDIGYTSVLFRKDV